jgi:hypothetical protein
MLNLLIKGDLHAAAKAADAHGVKIIAMQCLYGPGKPLEVHASVDDSALAKVLPWFLEDSGAAPFPAGSLLHYSKVED